MAHVSYNIAGRSRPHLPSRYDRVVGYALPIAIAVTLVCTLAVFTLRVVRSGTGVPLFGGWRWHPSLLGFSVALLLAGLLLWRVFPELVFLPIVVPIFWWGRWGSKRRRDSDNDAQQRRLPPSDDQ
jgi:hypothetical protein